MHNDQVMNLEHPLWNEFIERLSHAVICDCTTANARQVLNSMQGIDVQRSLEALCLKRGRCDCEIVYNVARLAPSHA
jgi:hypothetical protein